MRRYLPLGIDVRGRRCIVVGAGEVGTRKALTLSRAGAEVVVIAPEVAEALAGAIDGGGIQFVRQPFREDHLEGAFLVVAATDDGAVNAAVVAEAARREALVCDATRAERSGVIFGAILDRDDVTVAVFTDGRDPALAARTRDRIRDRL
jgi:uroporphyrin-III C-methyltransferase/precorrin-2 dehydrogenase/sirohydrochlorin ferrochelatase